MKACKAAEKARTKALAALVAAAADVATFVRAFSGAPAGKRAHDFLAARSSHNDAHAADRAKYIALNTKLRELKVAAIKATKQHAATLKKQKAGNAERMWSIGDSEQGFEAMLKDVCKLHVRGITAARARAIRCAASFGGLKGAANASAGATSWSISRA